MNFDEVNPLSISSLTAAVEFNSLDTLYKLIKLGRNVNVVDNRGWTPLHKAAALNDRTEFIKALKKAGARSDVTTHNAETALWIACRYGVLENVKLLLTWNKKLVNMSNYEDLSPLHVVVQYERSLPFANLLIGKGADVNTKDVNGETPLHIATRKKMVKMCKFLLESGAKLNSRDEYGNNPLYGACCAGCVKTLELLLSHYGKEDCKSIVNETNVDGVSLLTVAAQSQWIEIVEELLKNGADPNINDVDGVLPLHAAVHSGNVEILKCIYNVTSKEVIVNYCTLTENDLTEKLERNDEAIFNSLLGLAVDSESIECVQFLLDNVSDIRVLKCPFVSQIDRKYETVVCYLSHCGYKQRNNNSTQFCMSNDCSEFVNDYGETTFVVMPPLVFLFTEKVFGFKLEDIKEIIRSMFCRGFSLEQGACAKNYVLNHLEAVLYMYNSYQWMEGIQDFEKIRNLTVECLQLMIEHGLDPDFRLNRNSMPLLFVYATLFKMTDIINFLLQTSDIIEPDDLFKWIIHCMGVHSDLLEEKSLAGIVPPYKICGAEHKFYVIKYLLKLISWPNISTTCCGNITCSEIRDCISTHYTIPSLKHLCRSTVRKAIHGGCSEYPHQFKMRLHSLDLPQCLISFICYNDLT